MPSNDKSDTEEEDEVAERVQNLTVDDDQPPNKRPTEEVENYDDEPDETITERLWGLTEMFPNPLRNFCGKATNLTCSGVKNLYVFSCNASWIFFTTSVILFAPVLLETERAQMEELQRSQQKQVLLGPGSAMVPGGGPALPPMQR